MLHRLLHSRLTALLATTGLVAATSGAFAQYDPAGVLRRAEAAMGADKVRTLRYAGSGMAASYGQAYVPGTVWPKLNVSRYTRQVDYENVYTNEELVRGRAEPKGGGAVPLIGEAPAGAVANATQSWNTAGQGAAPRQAALVQRQHDLWITPHGVLKAAAKNRASLAFRNVAGKEMAAVSFAVPGVMSATALINDAYLVERVESRVPDPVMGDTSVVTTYSGYRDFGGIQFPTKIEQTIAGSMTLSINVNDVQPNAAVSTAVPDNVAKWTERVAAEKVAEGVYFLAGGSHNSVAIEMKDHVVLVEAPLDDGRTSAVIAETKKLIPGKPIRYVVNSHNHFDHSGGLRTAVAEGATIVTQAQSKPWFEKVFANPNRIAPDMLAKSGKKAKIVGVKDVTRMTDGSRVVEIRKIDGTDHGDAMMMVYLPAEKILVQADLFTPGPPNAPVSNPPNAYHVQLVKNLADQKLAVERILPLHGRVVPVAELNRMVGK